MFYIGNPISFDLTENEDRDKQIRREDLVASSGAHVFVDLLRTIFALLSTVKIV